VWPERIAMNTLRVRISVSNTTLKNSVFFSDNRLKDAMWKIENQIEKNWNFKKMQRW